MSTAPHQIPDPPADNFNHWLLEGQKLHAELTSQRFSPARALCTELVIGGSMLFLSQDLLSLLYPRTSLYIILAGTIIPITSRALRRLLELALLHPLPDRA